jgi:acyl transferase domain-containing protein/NAD(P)-dependent dehydrogenase (short-subunit alcohol dehydrogenase family)/acyl carrier protein
VSNSPESIQQSAQLKRALLTLKKLRSTIEGMEKEHYEPIAIIGIGCRFPQGVNDPESFWHLLHNGLDVIREVPAERWDIDAFYDPDPDAPGKMSSRYGGFLDRIELFDAQFFGIAPREALNMDPQQRVLMEVVWEALERAGLPPDRMHGSRTGVFITTGTSGYGQAQFGANSVSSAYLGTGATPSVAAGRLSYQLGLSGPSLAIDTACSSSLVALHLACQSIHSNECDMALAGGVNIILSPGGGIYFSKLRTLASDGHCKTFDKRADGYVRSEGCGIVVLKRLSQALEERDPILAVIRGSAVNQDGRSSGLTAPNGPAQEQVIRSALTNARMQPGQISYVEAHGSGTALGDPIEIYALGTVLKEGRPADRPVAVGAVKTNIGHTETVAGIAGLIKTVLALQHQEIPPNLHFQEPNPYILWSEVPVHIPTSPLPWEPIGDRRSAGVSAFGFSGTNAHVILEEAPALALPDEEEPGALQEQALEVLPSFDPVYLLPLSARQEQALRELAEAYLTVLAKDNEEMGTSLTDICYTASARRSHYEYRLSLVGHSAEELSNQLRAFLHDEASPGMFSGQKDVTSDAEVVFVLPGLGSQWLGMGRQLFAQEAAFRATLEECDRVFQHYVSWSLLKELWADEESSQLDSIDVSQPMVFALQIALAALWRSWGITPGAVIGHSMGEVAAAYIAGVLSLEDAAKIICRRSFLLRRVQNQGTMALVELSMGEIERFLVGYEAEVSIAAINGPRSVLIAGTTPAILHILTLLEEQHIFCRRIKVDVAAHSPQIDILREDLLSALVDIEPREATIPLYSVVNGAISAGRDLNAEYWVRNMREPVLFWPMLQQLVNDGYKIFVELSPNPVLLPAIQRGLRETASSAVVLPSLQRTREERALMLESLGALYTQGCTIAWQHMYATVGQHSSQVPIYPWQRERFWLSDALPVPMSADATTGEQTWSEQKHYLESSVQSGLYFWERIVDLTRVPYLADHRVQGTVVFPAAASLDMALMACSHLFGSKPYVIEQIVLKSMMTFSEDEQRQMQLSVSNASLEGTTFRLLSRLRTMNVGDDQPDWSSWTEHVVGRIRPVAVDASSLAALPPLDQVQARCGDVLSGAEIYTDLQEHGIAYGPSFQNIERIWRRDGEAIAKLTHPASHHALVKSWDVIHPGLLDAGLQALGAAVPLNTLRLDPGQYLPVQIDSLSIHGPVDTICWSYARSTHEDLAHPEGDLRQGDVWLLDEQGQIVLEIRGLKLRRLEPRAADLENALTNSLYDLQWISQALPPSEHVRYPAGPGLWIIFAPQNEDISLLKAELEARGEYCLLVLPGSHYALVEPDTLQLNPSEPAHYRSLCKEIAARGSLPCRGIMHLWSLDASFADDLTLERLQSAQTPVCESVVYLVQALAQSNWRDLPRLWLVTQGVHTPMGEQASFSIAQAPLWGLSHAITFEYPDLFCTRIDLGQPLDKTWKDLFAECWYGVQEQDSEISTSQNTSSRTLQKVIEDQVLLRAEGRLVARVECWTPPQATDSSTHLIRAQEQDFHLRITRPGSLEYLKLHALTRRAPGPEEVEIEVYAAGLNFLDVLSALSALPTEANQTTGTDTILGSECAGRVLSVGANVRGLSVGQEVIALAPYSIGTVVVTHHLLVVEKPAFLSMEEAATIPIAFLTAYYALQQRAALQAGERILIHAATGGVGLAAVQIARQVGAEIFATAGSAEKRAFLKQLGVQHVFDSRSLSFAQEILQSTAGQGVDVVLNSLTGEAVVRGLEVLREHGRFVEIGKQDYYQNKQLGLRPFLKNLSFSLLDLRSMIQKQPERIHTAFQHIIQQFHAGHLRALPLQLFPITQVEDAFYTMAQAQHIGKLVISLANRQEAFIVPAPRPPLTIRQDGSYLITGGVGQLGLCLARWLAEQGASSLIVTGRHAPSKEGEQTLEELRALGTKVTVFESDVAQEDSVKALIDYINRNLAPLRGVVHAAGILDDTSLLNLNRERLSAVMAPKVAGSWNLHKQTLQCPLDFFVMYSSIASLFGSYGQGNYAAANAFMDALAHYRQSKGLPALSINWGPWARIGLAATHQSGEHLQVHGIKSIEPEQGMELFAYVLKQEITQVGVITLDLRQWSQSYPFIANLPFLSHLLQEQNDRRATQKNPLKEKLFALEPEMRRTILEEHVILHIAQVLRLDAAKLHSRSAIGNLGFDSLMAMELRNRLEASLGCTLSATLVWSYRTVAALAEHLAHKIQLPLPPASVAEVARTKTDPPTHVYTEDVVGVSSLSKEEADRLILEELSDLASEFIE